MHDPRFALFADRMRQAGQPAVAADNLAFHYGHLLRGESAQMSRAEIAPVDALLDSDGLAPYRVAGEAALGRVVCIKLNGGLGTGMGLTGPKSLLPVRDGLTFLDIICRNVLAQRRPDGNLLPLLLMNSQPTQGPTAEALRAYPELTGLATPWCFLQHVAPKVDAQTLGPVVWPADPELEWYPLGHGDLYAAMLSSGVLGRLLDAGYAYAFVSNADNLGAVLDPCLLGYLAESGASFLMEAVERTQADRKGGHLCQLRDGRLALREIASCPPDELEEFQDVDRYRYFNTNNLWLHLPTLRQLLEDHHGVLPLTTIVNRKTVDPREKSSPGVVQLETAMGSALSLFPGATAVCVDRARFSPVKNCNDLLNVRSDAYALTDDHRVVLNRDVPTRVALDPDFYGRIDDFEARFPCGAPSLLACTSLRVDGGVTFGRDVVLRGEVHLRGSETPRIPDGAVLAG